MSVDNEKELQQLRCRFRELAEKAYHQNIYIFTGFLGLAEQDLFWQMERELSYAGCQMEGSCRQGQTTDRKVLRFGDPASFGYEEPFPIVCVHMQPLAVKFAEQLSHRDFLGALMNLGIDRSTIGDIKVGEKEGYLFCLDTIGEFICENLNKVRHTNIRCRIVQDMGMIPEEQPEEIQVLVSGERADGVVAKVYHMSRTDSLELFREKRVYINGRLCENNGRPLKPGDVVNARGYGKFVYQGIAYETKKEKLCLNVALYR